MSSLFDFDNSQDLVFAAKTAGKQIISAKHEALTKLGAFLFLAHSDNEFALRCQMFDNDLTAIANRRLATVSDSKGKLVRALHAEWSMRHATCKCAKDYDGDGKQESDAKEHAGVVHNAIQEEKGGKADGQDTTKIEASVDDSLKGTSSSSDSPLNEAVDVNEPTWSKKTKTVESSVDSPATTPPSSTDPGTSAAAADDASTTVAPMNTNSDSESGHNMNSVPSMTAGVSEIAQGIGTGLAVAVPASIAGGAAIHKVVDKIIKKKNADPATGSEEAYNATGFMSPKQIQERREAVKKTDIMTAGIKSSNASCNCGEEAISNFNGKPSCLPGMGCQTSAQSGNCPGCGQSFHGFNVCKDGNCQSNPEQELMLKTIMKLKNEIKQLMGNGNGESLETIMRHDKGHDDWHRSMGQEPCSSEEDCAAKTKEHESMEHTSSVMQECANCGRTASDTFHNQPMCLPGQGCNLHAAVGEDCPACGARFHNHNVCSEGTCIAVMPEHSASVKKSSEDHYKYIKKQGDSWVITQKGTGKVLSHHDSKEAAISSFKAMMANKHG